MVPKKGKSKRQTLSDKFKIAKRTKEHHRKLKKEVNRKKKKGIKGVVQKQKDPGIPNEYPHKEELLKQIERAKEQLEERKAAQKEARKDARRTALAEKRGLAAGSLPAGATLPGLAEAALSRAAAFDASQGAAAELAARAGEEVGAEAADGRNGHGQRSRRAFLKELRKVVEAADVVLEVLDARDPMGSRCRAVEAAVAAQPNKRLVLVLNKVDLVPKEVAAGWLAVLRRSAPVVAFKASTAQTVGRASSAQLASAEAVLGEDALQRSTAVGVEALMGLLKNYCRAGNPDGSGGGSKLSIQVGVVGYPNTGKSSLINSLKCRNVVSTSSAAGHTKAMATVVLDKQVTLLDSPGVVFDDSDAAATALRNCVNPEELDDPQAAVGHLLGRVAAEQLMQLYALPRFAKGDADAFLSLMARRLGKVKKGGIPDKDSAARAVLKDWNSGVIKYFSAPPADTAHLLPGAAAIVSGFAASFDPATMMAQDALVLEASPSGAAAVDFVAMDAVENTAGDETALMEGSGDEDDEDDEEDEDESAMGSDEEDEEDDEDEEELPTQPAPKAKGAKQLKGVKGGASLDDPALSFGLATGSTDGRRSHKASLKKAAKHNRRAGRSMDAD